jgi:hypothetical protein
MKKHTFLFALLGISTLTLLARQGSQDMNPLAAGASNHPPALSHADLTNTKEGEPESALPTARLQQSFAKLYPLASQATWARLDNKYWVSFTHKGQKTTAVFRENGKLSYSIVQLAVANIPAELQQVINKDYAHCRVISAAEVNNGGNIFHQVILENETNYITLKKSADELEVTTIKNTSKAALR